MATQTQRRTELAPKGEALMRDIMANEELVAEGVEAQRRLRAGEPGIRWEVPSRFPLSRSGRGAYVGEERRYRAAVIPAYAGRAAGLQASYGRVITLRLPTAATSSVLTLLSANR